MNDNDKNSNINKDSKNSKVPVFIKDSVPRSTQSRYPEFSQLGNKVREKTELDVSTDMTKPLCSILAERGPKIHESKKKVHADKSCAGQTDKTAFKTTKKPRSQVKQEKKYSTALASNEKSVASASSRKIQSNLKSDQNKVDNDPKDSKSKKTLYKTNWKKTLPKAKDLFCKTVQSPRERNTQTDLRNKDVNEKQNSFSRSATKESAKFYRKQENCYSKRYLEKINAKDKNQVNGKIRNYNDDDLKKVKEKKRISPQENVEINKTVSKKIVHDKNNIDTNDGAARTRIFKREKSLIVNKCHEIKAECSKHRPKNDNLMPVKELNMDEKERKIDDIVKRDNCTQDSVDSSYNDETHNVISLYHKEIGTPESGSDYNQYQESQETVVDSIEKKSNNDLSSAPNSKTSYEQVLSTNPDLDSSQAKEFCLSKNASKDIETELISASTKTSNHDKEEAGKSLAVNEVRSASQDEIKYHTNLMNYGYQSDQQYCKRFNKHQSKENTADAAVNLIGVDNTQCMIDEEAKYNLIKALTQPNTDIHDFRGAGCNKVNKLFMPGRGSESIINCRDGGLQNYCTHSSSNGLINEGVQNVLNTVERSEVNDNNLKNYETVNPHTSSIVLQKPTSNTSECIAMNLRMKGCKYTKKYRHFRHEEKNMCCDMSRYIKKIVSAERRYKGFDKSENPERKEVKIIIDENSPKTSKIRIVNDRSSVSVVCHSFGRTLSTTERKNNTATNRAESSGGESSGYKSFNNNSNTENFDVSEEIVKCSGLMKSHHPRDVLGRRHNSSTTFYQNDDAGGSENTSDPFYSGYQADQSAGEIRKDLDNEEKMCNRNHELEYTSYDTSNYLSTFTNRMDVYLPCEITAYQFEEKKGSKIFELNSKELMERKVDSAELHIGEYLNRENSEEKDDSSEAEEFSEDLSSEEEHAKTIDDDVITLKEPDNLQYRSQEFVTNERLSNPDDPGLETDSSDISVVPAHYEIPTSLLDIKPAEASKTPDLSTHASRVKFVTKNDGSETTVKTSTNNLRMKHSDTRFPPAQQQAVTKDTRHKRSENYGITCLGKSRNKNERLDDSNAVHELWSNRKSIVDSTDTESQKSGRFSCKKSGPKKNEANKFKFNIFRKLKSSASEKTINVPLNQLPKPPPSFLKSNAPSQSTIISSSVYNDASQSDFTTKSNESAASIIRINSPSKSQNDIPAIHYIKQNRQRTISNEKIINFKLERSEPTPTPHKLIEAQPKKDIAPPTDERLLGRTPDIQPVVPQPMSSSPPPHPFCCPLVPYMMQYWQNGQQPPPASTVPLPEAVWKPIVGMAGSEPPPPDMVPIPWFPPTMHQNIVPTTGQVESIVPNNLHGQAPPDWLMMPRGYAPCLPCSRTSESNRRNVDSLIYEDDEPSLETGENKQDVKTNKVSYKLFKIFRRKNRPDVETLDEDDKKVKYRRRRLETRLNNVQAVQNGQQPVEDRNIWESPDIAGIVTPEEIGRCFRRGFRADGLTLSGDNYLCTREPSDTSSEQEDIFNFSDHDTPLDFLLALGFSVDEATAAIRDDEVRSRFKAALTEARIWVPHIATTQGTLLYLLAMKAKPKVMRYFLQLVESIVNKRITNAVKLDAYLKILEKVEEGYVSFVTLFGKESGKEDEEDTVIVEKQRRRIFYTIYKYAETEAKEVDKPLTKASVDLLHSLAARYRSAIGPHLKLLACYIGEGLLTKDVQLEAALIYLSRLDSSDVKLADLEKYCGLPPSERRRIEHIEKKRLPGKNQ